MHQIEQRLDVAWFSNPFIILVRQRVIAFLSTPQGQERHCAPQPHPHTLYICMTLVPMHPGGKLRIQVVHDAFGSINE